MDAEDELYDLRRVLSDLAEWAERHLNGEANRQCIAEHLTGSLAALVNGDPLPRSPF